jgi:hypothetical protein
MGPSGQVLPAIGDESDVRVDSELLRRLVPGQPSPYGWLAAAIDLQPLWPD